MTRQLPGMPGSPFAYRGNIGPSLVPAPLMSRLRQLGNVLISAFRLVGLFGVDYIQHDDEPWLVEINPRYTASAEVFELATHRTLLTEHLRACGMDLVESPPPWETADRHHECPGRRQGDSLRTAKHGGPGDRDR